MTYAVLFPGQGSQSVGMCPDVRTERSDLFDTASAVLGWDLGNMIAVGPEEDLTSTEHAQPALFVTGLALWLAFAEAVDGGPTAMAGHSLGEYTALAAAGALAYTDGVKLVSERGRAMAVAAAETPSGMAALIGADEQVAEAACAARRDLGGGLFVANINAPGQIVVAGGADDLEWLESNARDLGIRRVIALKVAGAFHSPFMNTAKRQLVDAVARVEFGTPSVSVFANATARPVTDPADSLVQQLTSPVLFAETLENMASSGIDTFVHVGPGDVTAGLARRTVPTATVLTVSSLADARGVGETLSVQ